MKLLVFCPYYPPHIGGLESHADEFNQYLSQKGMDITVFTPQLPKEAPENQTKYNTVTILRFPAFEIIPNYPLPKFWSLKFWRLFIGLFKRRFDIVISRTRFFSTSLLAFFYAKIKNTKWVHIEHGSDFVSLNSSLFSAIAKLYDYTFGKLILAASNYNVANSKASADFCRKLAKRDCDIIYRGVETGLIENAIPNLKLKSQYPDKIIITFAGRLIDGKGVADLLNATENLENIICFIIGDGPQKSQLEKMAEKLGIREKIDFLGRLPFEDTMSILKISDIVVNPSYTEGLPTSIIEAALCKKAIVATNVGGTPEIITSEKSGYLINPKEISTMKNKLEILISNPELRAELSKNAYEEVKDKFNWNKSIEKYMKIFNELI